MAGTAPFEYYSATDYSQFSGSAEDLAKQLTDEFRRLEAVLTILVEGGILPETYNAPTKLRNGMVRLADGTKWNPGSGRGIYWYDGALPGWRKLV